MASRAAQVRWTLVGVYWAAQWVIGFLVWMTFFYERFGAVKWSVWAHPVKALSSGGTLIPGAIIAALVALMALQAIFLLPVRKPAFGLRGTPLWLSLTTAGLSAAGLLTAALLAFVDIVWLAGPAREGSLFSATWWVPWMIGCFVLASWAVATPLLFVFCRRRGPQPEPALARIASRLFLGTIIEAAAIIPVDVLVRRRQPCYCEQGTFWALTICLSVGVVALGPAIVLPILARRRKRWYAGRCDACGYNMAGTPAADRCPECGAGWRRATDPCSE